MAKNSGSLDSQLEKLRQEAAESEQKVRYGEARLDSLKKETAALEASKSRVMAEIADTTLRLVGERRAQLDKEQEDRETEVALGEGYLVAIEQEMLLLEADREHLETELEILETEVRTLTATKTDLEAQVSSAKDALTVIELDIAKAEATRTKAQQPIADLQESITTLESQVADLTQQRNHLATVGASELASHETTLGLYEVKVEEAAKQLSRLREGYQEERKQQELERADLAARILAADKRDVNLRIRERKAREREAFIQTNNALLDL